MEVEGAHPPWMALDQTGEKRVGVADAGGTGEFRHESGGHKYTHACSQLPLH